MSHFVLPVLVTSPFLAFESLTNEAIFVAIVTIDEIPAMVCCYWKSTTYVLFLIFIKFYKFTLFHIPPFNNLI
ncbi:hypothetical protein HYE44_01055 [Mycoplasmopsis bovis]|nr:hypothetical protein [Mycoplasmopsis bovis]QQH19931.1 hypothetical protein HYE44_01055 [Mycoplasmopsis bovis]QQH22739.1 hypothetical protein HYE29_01195 [Mycoplasmopsis bovis]QQH24076.1 hypothetical protein HYE22_01155 [Mycoplasmopsis bovis]QQH72728.1 hypothetical protein HYD49_01165 [Mycoplasmopsis bovis]